MGYLKRGELARRCGINIEALRYYENRRLLDPPLRSEKGYRLYTGSDAARVRFIKNAQKLGFTLEEIAELLKLRVRKGKACGPVLRKAQGKLDEVEKKIRNLKSMRKALTGLIEKCRTNAPTSDCPILENFEMEAEGKTASRSP
ncbi:MAG: heavy metal-responsive transcriptional regulator [Nitrospinales bacterium]